MDDYTKYELIAFDLDKTLARSKAAIQPHMAKALAALLEKYYVAIVSGGSLQQFKTQLVAHLSLSDKIKQKLYLLPTCGAMCYRINTDNSLEEIYTNALSESQKAKITAAFERLKQENTMLQIETWGPQLEDRESQITFSCLGQLAPVEEKEAWDPTRGKKDFLVNQIKDELSEFLVVAGGSTSIDVTQKGIDKAYGVKRLIDIIPTSFEKILYIGDELQEGGNDYIIKEAGFATIQVRNPDHTFELIQSLLSV